MCIVTIKKADGTTEVRTISPLQFQPTGRTLTVDERRAAPSPRPATVRDEYFGATGCGVMSSTQHYHPRGKVR
jgi:hypothetical protein